MTRCGISSRFCGVHVTGIQMTRCGISSRFCGVHVTGIQMTRCGISSRFCGVQLLNILMFCAEFCRSLFVHMMQDMAIVHLKHQDDRGLEYIIQRFRVYHTDIRQ